MITAHSSSRITWDGTSPSGIAFITTTVLSSPTMPTECILYADMWSNMMQANSYVRTIFLSSTPMNCLEWRPVDAPWLANLVVVNEIGANGVNYMVGRLIHGSRTLPATYQPYGSFLTTDGIRHVTTRTGAFLIVHVLCPYQRVTWTSTSGNDLPSRMENEFVWLYLSIIYLYMKLYY